MAIEQIKETDTLNQGRIKINAILDQSNASVEKIKDYQDQLTTGINDAKKLLMMLKRSRKHCRTSRK